MAAMSATSVIIPCYGSEMTLHELTSRVRATLVAADVADFEVIMVVDGSPDNAAEVAREIAVSDQRFRAIELRRNYGQHNALVAGIEAAQYPVLITMDDDLQHRPEDLPTLIAKLENDDVDLVYATARTEEHGMMRSFASVALKTGLRAAGVQHAQQVSAFRCFRTDLRDGFSHSSDPFVNLDVMLNWGTTSISSVAVDMQKRQHGKSGYRLSTLIRMAISMVTGYSESPLRFVAYLGILSFVAGLGILVVVLVAYFTGIITVPGFTSIAAMIALFSGTQMLAIGVVGEYLARIHYRTVGRPTFVIARDSARPDAT